MSKTLSLFCFSDYQITCITNKPYKLPFYNNKFQYSSLFIQLQFLMFLSYFSQLLVCLIPIPNKTLELLYWWPFFLLLLPLDHSRSHSPFAPPFFSPHFSLLPPSFCNMKSDLGRQKKYSYSDSLIANHYHKYHRHYHHHHHSH